MTKPFRCNCGRHFGSKRAVEDHRRDFHKGKDVGFTMHKPEPHEPSLADRSIDAILDRAMGIPNDDDWLIEGMYE